MLSVRHHLFTFGLVICSFTIIAAQEDKTLDTQPSTLTPTAPASTTGPAMNPNPDAINTERRAIVSPATGTGTRNFLAKWLETGGQGRLGNSLIEDTGGAVSIGSRLNVETWVNASHYQIGGQRVLGIRGTLNTFVGVAAGGVIGANTTGEGNSFFGSEAGRNNDSGTGNAFFGAWAGRGNVHGNLNSFFGREAGLATSFGSSNSFFGASAGKTSTTGRENVFIGESAGAATTTGNFNTFVGTRAGSTNRDGHSNTLIGHDASLLQTGLSFATAIGAGSSVSASNSVVLGRGSGDDTVFIPGQLTIRTLGGAGSTELCRNSSLRVATCSSSLRYKRDVTPYVGGLNLINQLRPIVFRWKTDGTPDVGFGAEDVVRVAPLFVTRNSEGEIEGVKYRQLSAALVSAVQEQQAQIAAQQEQLKRQQSQIDQQRNQLQRQQNQIESLKRLVCLAHPQGEGCK